MKLRNTDVLQQLGWKDRVHIGVSRSNQRVDVSFRPSASEQLHVDKDQ